MKFQNQMLKRSQVRLSTALDLITSLAITTINVVVIVN